MKKDIHPHYNSEAKVTCACGATFVVGSTKDELRTELCSQCHPFFTGKKKLVDTAGRVDRFRAKMEQASKAKATKASTKKKSKMKVIEDTTGEK